MATSPTSSTGSSLGSSLASAADEAAAATDNTLNRAVQGAHSMVDRVAEKAGPAVERVREGLNNASASLQNSADELSEAHRRMLESCRSCVRDHPLTAIGIAVVTGLVLSRLMSRD